MKKMSAVLATAGMTACLLFSGTVAQATERPTRAPDAATRSENLNLTLEEAKERLSVINSTYTNVGDEVTDSDAEFLRIYALGDGTAMLNGNDPAASKENSTRGTVVGKFNKSATGRGLNASGNVKGYARTTNGVWFSNSWATSYVATGTGTVNRIKACTHVRAWGLGASGAFSLTYRADPCATTNGKTNSFSRTAAYTGFIGASTISYDATFFTPKGSFQISY